MTLYTYRPNQVVISVAGLVDVTGYADGTFVEIEKDVAPYIYQSAADGETSRTFRDDRNYTVKISLAQSSPTNNKFSLLHNLDLRLQVGKLPLMIKDTAGTSQFFSPSAWIENFPSISFSKDIEVVTWTFKCSNSTFIAGGNDRSLTNDALDVASILSSILGG